MSRISVQEVGTPNVLAFLDTIAFSEIGATLLLATDDGYNVLVGSTPQKLLVTKDYSHHPHILNTALNSTAAGRYQIIWPTWKNLDLPDFTPENQDRACIKLITGRGALEAITTGDIEHAIYLCRKEWASLPGAGYNQHENELDNLISYYKGALERYV